MRRKEIHAEGAIAVGPYSHAVEIDGVVYLSGQTPIDPQTGGLVEGDIKAQTTRCFLNLKAVLQAGGLTFDNVIKVNVYLTDMKHFQAMNEIYATQFKQPFPARTTIGVKELPLNALVEIEMIAKQ